MLGYHELFKTEDRLEELLNRAEELLEKDGVNSKEKVRHIIWEMQAIIKKGVEYYENY